MKHSNRLRIIGGRWRSRVLHFPAINALRPTPDGVRETVFNWLAPDISGRQCLDLYAGSGALGIEAVSRGAASAILVEKNPKAAKALSSNVELLCANSHIHVTCCAALHYLSTTDQQFNLIFLDPPFASDELKKACYQINKMNVISDDGLIYIESPSNQIELPVPEKWQIIKQATKGEVRYTMLHCN